MKAEDIKNWADFLGTVKKIKAAGIVPIAGGGGEKWPIHFYWSYLVMREGGQKVFEAAKTGGAKVSSIPRSSRPATISPNSESSNRSSPAISARPAAGARRFRRRQGRDHPRL